LYCAVQSKVLGNIVEHNSEQRYFEGEDHLKDIIQNHCDNCNHDYVGIPPRGQQAKQLAMQVANKLHAQDLLKGAHRRILRSDRRRSRQFAANIDRLRTLGNIAKPWPAGGNSTRVLICGWYGTETLGDKGILGGVLQALREHLGALNVVLVSLFPYVSEMTRRQMDELKGVHIVPREQGVQLAAQADLVVFGGGPLMAIDETADMLTIFESAQKAGGKTLVAGCGVGPLGAEWHNAAIKQILQYADARIYRDEKSRGIAARLGVDVQSDLVAEDPAFTWLATQRQTLLQTRHSDTGKVLLLGLRDFPYVTYARHLSEAACLEAKQRYEKAVLDALSLLTEQYPDLVIRPLPMCTNHFGDDDRWYYRRLFRGHDKLASHLDLSLLGAERGPIDYCHAFKQATVALTMRFHSVVFALGLEVPTVAIDYTLGQGKVHALAERFGVPYRSLSELDANFITREVAQLLETPRPQAPGFLPSFTSAMHTVLTTLGVGVRNTELIP
jgi:polysaccharide pyruvyl transferase WcaK-like protein